MTSATIPTPKRHFRVTIPTAEIPAFRAAMESAQYVTQDTGERITTDEGPEAETILVVSVPTEAALTRAERVAALLVP